MSAVVIDQAGKEKGLTVVVGREVKITEHVVGQSVANLGRELSG